MASVDERHLGIARVYARAMLDIAEEQNAAESLGDELADLVALSQMDPDLEGFLSSPVLDSDSRRETFERAFRGRASDLLIDSLQVINKKGRLGLLEPMLVVYQEELRALRGEVEVKIATAVPLTEEQREDVRTRASEFTGKKAFLIEDVNADLLGGLVLQIGDQKVDMSVSKDLELLSNAYAKRLSSELLSGRQFATESDSAESQDGREEE